MTPNITRRSAAWLLFAVCASGAEAQDAATTRAIPEAQECAQRSVTGCDGGTQNTQRGIAIAVCSECASVAVSEPYACEGMQPITAYASETPRREAYPETYARSNVRVTHRNRTARVRNACARSAESRRERRAQRRTRTNVRVTTRR